MRPSRRRRPALLDSAWAPLVARFAFALIVFFANSNFNERVLPGATRTTLQQSIVIGLWIIILFATYFQRARLRLDLQSTGLRVALCFYAFAAASVVWSNDPIAGLLKSLALLLTAFGAYRLLVTTPLDDIIESVIHGLFLLTGLSMALALFAPDIGILSAAEDFQHPGQWRGVFFVKQTLGVVAGLQLFFVSYRMLLAPRGFYHGLYYALGAFIALACELGSGSRGGAAVAAAALLSVFLSKRSMRFAEALAYAPLAMSIFSLAPMIYLFRTGAQSFNFFGEEIDFTERVAIWQYAISHFSEAPWLGYGLNGFWTVKEIRDVFLEKHGWFLDNFHSGYIAVVIETGAVGMGLFILTSFFYARRVKAILDWAHALDAETSFALTYAPLVFFIDFTETFFLRSTNMATTMLVVSFLVTFAVRPSVVAEETPPAGVPAARPRSPRRSISA